MSFCCLSFVEHANAQEDSLNLFEIPIDSLLKIKVVSASQQVEPFKEVPVPVTVITKRMIEASSAQSLLDLLITYVPAYTYVQDHNEINVAARGVYASSQQKILILLNGHRINSRAYSSANPDFSISLEKIEQIEIIRGPGSSLYGNVALTGVINIITKKSEEINGLEVGSGIGNYGQAKVSLLYGNKTEKETDFILWGSFYKANGQEVPISAENDYSEFPKSGQAIVGGFDDRPSFDLGFSYENKGLTFLGNIQNSKYVEPFSAGGTSGEVYNYSDYRTFLGTGPGLGMLSAHFSIDYQYEFKKQWSLLVNPYFDMNSITGVAITNPQDTAFISLSWKDYDVGAIVSLRKKYSISENANGDILFGFQYDGMDLYDSFFLAGTGGEFTTVVDRSGSLLLEKGDESIYSAFVQLKHYFGKKMILNVGLRYDYKDRHKGGDFWNISPRLALVYIPKDLFDFKISYSSSFVDAPYWYRYNFIPSYQGAESLLPEYLSSIQLTSNLHLFDNRLNYQINGFYNVLKDFIFRDVYADGVSEPKYKNAGRLESVGIENELSFRLNYFTTYANFTWQHALSAQDYGVTNEQIHNIPNLSGNLVFDFYPFYFKKNKLIINLTGRFIGKQLSPIEQTFKGGQPFEDLSNQVNSVFLLNSAINVTKFYGFKFRFQISNLFNTEYYQGGSVNFPYPQQGRWYMLSVFYKIKI